MDTPSDNTNNENSSSTFIPQSKSGPSRPTARDNSGFVTARGTGEGLVLRVDGRIEQASLKLAVHDFVTSRRVFLEGNDVIIEWAGKLPDPQVEAEITKLLTNTFSITVRSTRLWDKDARSTSPVASSHGFDSTSSPSANTHIAQTSASSSYTRDTEQPSPSKRPSLFDGLSIEKSDESFATERSYKDDYQSFAGSDAYTDTPAKDRNRSENYGQNLLSTNTPPQIGSFGETALEDFDNADARVIYGTLRGGQRIESEHSVIVFGDVNSGAEVIAGGDVIVLGNLRGVAHAGAYDENGGGRVIFSLNLEPTQLRIGLVISRGANNSASGNPKERSSKDKADKCPEIAKVDGNTITVEPFFGKQLSTKGSFVSTLARKVTGRKF